MTLVNSYISSYEFIDTLNKVRPDNFSREGLLYIYEHYDNQEDNVEFDVISICCTWVECDKEELKDYFGDTVISLEGDDLLEHCQGNTHFTALENGSYLFMNF